MRYLLVGLGNIGKKRLAILGSQCIGTVDPFNLEATYRSSDSCSPEGYEAVILSVPNGVKIELLESFLSQGKHVLVDKPLLFPDRATVNRMADLARANGGSWQTAYNHRFEPLILRLKDVLALGTIGRIYCGRLFYGNGTVGNVIGTWREQGLGVLEDLGTHLLDLLDFLFDSRPSVETVSLSNYEARCFDHSLLLTEDHRFVLEMSLLSWKNSFVIELVGERGSMHLTGLCKWGSSELVIRERVLPSGVPNETMERQSGPDPTWAAELRAFEQNARPGATSADGDWWMSNVLHHIASPL